MVATPRKIVFLILLAVAMVLWLISISLAVKGGFFENELALQLMVLGGATSMVGGAIWWPWD
jgi:hypothetical protein